MGLISKEGIHTVKLNPSQIFTLFTIPLTYDIPLISEYISRNTTQLAYEVAFDDYIRFILLETVKQPASQYASKYVQPHETATFLASDARLNQNARLVNRLILALGDGSKEHLEGRNFSNLHKEMKDAINIMFENFLLNMIVLQAKMVELQRWDNNHGDYVPYIIPTLGVFEALLNIKDIHLEFEEDAETGEDIPTKFEYLSEFTTPSNIFVGHLGKTACNELYDGIGFPEIELSYYLYKGIFKHAIPTGKLISKENLEILDSKVKALATYEAELNKCKEDLHLLLIQNNKAKVPREEFIHGTIALVTQLASEGKQIKSAYTKIVNNYTRICELESNVPEELTEKEKSVKVELDKIRSKPRFKDRYPQLTYDQHIDIINMKVLNGEEICLLEQSILDVDTYLNLLLRVLQLTGYLYEQKDDIYLLVPKLQQSVALEGDEMLSVDEYCLTDLIVD